MGPELKNSGKSNPQKSLFDHFPAARRAPVLYLVICKFSQLGHLDASPRAGTVRKRSRTPPLVGVALKRSQKFSTNQGRTKRVGLRITKTEQTKQTAQTAQTKQTKQLCKTVPFGAPVLKAGASPGGPGGSVWLGTTPHLFSPFGSSAAPGAVVLLCAPSQVLGPFWSIAVL